MRQGDVHAQPEKLGVGRGAEFRVCYVAGSAASSLQHTATSAIGAFCHDITWWARGVLCVSSLSGRRVYVHPSLSPPRGPCRVAASPLQRGINCLASRPKP